MRWFDRVDGQATRRAVELLAAWTEGEGVRRAPFWRRDRRRTQRIVWSLKACVGIPYDESWRSPGRPRLSRTDALGHWDRVICGRDVLEWSRKVRGYARRVGRG